MSVARWKVGRKKMSYLDKIKELEEEVRTKKEQMEFETSGKRLAILEEEVYNTEQSIEELKKHA